MNDNISPRPVGGGPNGIFDEETFDLTRGPSRQLRNSPTVRWRKTPRGLYADAKIPPSKGSTQPPQPKRYNFLKMFGDYYMTTQGIAVAKPWLLRASRLQQADFDGNIWNMTYLDDPENPVVFQARKKVFGTTIEWQRITPPYNEGDEIIAEQMDTGLSYLDDQGVIQLVKWHERIPQRMWARRINQTGF